MKSFQALGRVLLLVLLLGDGTQCRTLQSKLNCILPMKETSFKGNQLIFVQHEGSLVM